MDANTIITTAFSLGFGSITDRDMWARVMRASGAKAPVRKSDIDAFVAPAVAAGLLRIVGSEQPIKGCPGGRARPATTVRTSYRLTAAGDAALREWRLANLDHKSITPWMRKMLTEAA